MSTDDTAGLFEAVGASLTASSIHFAAGATVFRQGDTSDCAYIVESGELRATRVLNDEVRELRTFTSGELFGEAGLFDDVSRVSTVVAETDCEVLVIARAQMEREMETCAPLVRLMLKVLVGRYRMIAKLPGAGEATIGDAVLTAPQRADDTAHLTALLDIRGEKRLREAIVRREFELHYQPVFNLSDGTVAGFEALVRWMSPNEETVMPSEFIPLAERSGLMLRLGPWVMEQACHFSVRVTEHLARRDGALDPESNSAPFVSVNVSAVQLASDSGVEQLLAARARTDAAAQHIKLELTETVLTSDPERTAANLEQLRAEGFSLAVDDFGTGYASLSYLARYPFTTLKIDRAFVIAMDDEASFKVVRGIVVLARELQLDLVAEGIDSIEQLRLLGGLGCEYGQGFLFSEALPEHEALALLDAPPHALWSA